MKMTLSKFGMLSTEDIKKIDFTSRKILENIGVKITDVSYLGTFEKAGLKVDCNSQMVRFETEVLDKLLGHAPPGFTLFSRDNHHDIHLGNGDVHFTNGGRVFRILDMGTGGYRPTLLRDVANTATLVDRLDYIEFYLIACQAHDLEPEFYHLNDFYQAFNHTTKHVMGGCDNLAGVKQLWELACLMAGGEAELRDQPFVSVITNPISPLMLETNTLNILQFCTTHGIPATCAPAPMAGATSPATLAGTLSQMHAESLAGVAIAQIFAPGSRVLYGAVPTNMDLRTMELTMGSVEMGMMNAAAVQLAKLHKLPIYASGGLTEAKRPNIQAGFEKNFSNLMVAMSGADVIHLSAGMMDSGNSISYEQYVIDNENIGQIQRILRGITVNDDTLGIDVISQVGPGGAYLMEDHTVDHMMDEYYYPELSVRSNFDIWEERGRPNMLTKAHDRVQNILNECEECAEGIIEHDLNMRIEEAFPEIKNI